MTEQDRKIKQTVARRLVTTSKIRIGLVGYGMIGPIHLAAIAANADLFNIAAIVDSNPKQLSLLGGMGNIKLLTKIDDLLDDSNIEAVVLATPPQTHFSLAKAVIRARKHVLVEKPPTKTGQELRDLTDLARKMNVSLFTAEHAAFNSTVNGLLRLLSGEKIININIIYGENVLDWHPTPYQGVFLDGGVLRDSGYNAFSVINRLIPDEIKIISVQRTRPSSGVVERLRANGEVRQVNVNKFSYESRISIQFRFGGYGKGHFTQEWFRQEPNDVKLFILHTASGKIFSADINKEQIYQDNFKKRKLVYGQPNKILLMDMTPEYINLYAHFYESIVQGHSYVDYLPLKVIEEVYQPQFSVTVIPFNEYFHSS